MSKHDSSTPGPDHLPPESKSAGEQDSQSPAPQNELPRWATKQSASAPFSEARMAAYFGPRWETTYRAKLAPFFADPSFSVTWNWAAALGAPFWFLYRKLFATFCIFFAASNLAMSLLVTNVDPATFTAPDSPEAIRYLTMVGAVAFSTSLAAGGSANWFLFRRARAASMVVSLQQVPEDVAMSRLQQLGGVSIKAVVVGFAIITLLGSFAAAMGTK